MRYCTCCGYELHKEAKFCSSCGKQREQISVESVSPKKEKNVFVNQIKQPTVSQKHYPVEDKIKSQKWNSFLLQVDEVEKYVADGIDIPHSFFLSKFFKEKRDNNTRRNERMIALLKHRTCHANEEYIQHNQIKPEKDVILMVTEENKKIFGRGVSSFFVKSIDDNDQQFQELIKKEKTESGNIISSYPIHVISKEEEKGVLFITTKGLCFVTIKTDTTWTTSAPYAAMNAVGPGFGAIAAGVAAVTAKYITHYAINYKVDKQQQKIIRLAYKYSPCLIARCFDYGQFIPYNIINALLYGKSEKNNTYYMKLIYENIAKSVNLKMEKPVWDEIIKKLSGDITPRVESTQITF